MKNSFSLNRFFDILFIVTYSVGYVSLIKYVTYAILPFPETVQLFFFLLVLYLLRFGGKMVHGKINNGRVVLLLVALYIWELLQGLMLGVSTSGLLVSVFNLLSTFVAYRYISNIVNSEGGINQVIGAYSLYMYYTVFVVVLCSVLIFGSILSPYSNPLGINSLFRTNMETQNASYYFPGYLSVVYRAPSVFLSHFGFPSLSGLSHESQAMYFTIYPALFLLLSKSDKKHVERNILLIFLITTILTTSLTALVCFILTYTLHLLWKFKDQSQIGSALLILLFIIILVFFILSSQYNNILNSYVSEKTNFDTVGSSGNYSLNLFLYIFTPTSILGHGIYGSTAEQAMESSLNCGYISSIIIIIFYCSFIYTAFRNIFSKKVLCHSIGLATFYFIAHSFKYGIQIFNSNYIFFIVFLLTYAEKERTEFANRRQIGGTVLSNS